MDYKARSVVLANNWKKKQIKYIILLRDEMIKNNIDPDLIKKYVDDEYQNIELEYKERINKYLQKKEETNKNEDKLKQKSINFLFKTKLFLEKNNIDKSKITNYIDINYNKIIKS